MSLSRTASSEDSYNYNNQETDEVDNGDSIFVPHPPEARLALDASPIYRTYNVGVDPYTMELSRKSIIVKPIIQYVFKHVGHNQRQEQDLAQQKNSKTGERMKSLESRIYARSTFPIAIQDQSGQYTHHSQSQSGWGSSPQSTAGVSAGFRFDAGNYPEPGSGGYPSSQSGGYSGSGNTADVGMSSSGYSGGGGTSQMEPSYNNVNSNFGGSVPTPFSSQDLMGAYGVPSQHSPSNSLAGSSTSGSNGNGGYNSGPTMANFQPSHSCSSNWGWGCSGGQHFPQNNHVNINQAVSQAHQSSGMSHHSNSNLGSMLTGQFGSTPSIAEAIASLLRTIAKHDADRGRGSPSGPSTNYGTPSQHPGQPIESIQQTDGQSSSSSQGAAAGSTSASQLGSSGSVGSSSATTSQSGGVSSTTVQAQSQQSTVGTANLNAQQVQAAQAAPVTGTTAAQGAAASAVAAPSQVSSGGSEQAQPQQIVSSGANGTGSVAGAIAVQTQQGVSATSAGSGSSSSSVATAMADADCEDQGELEACGRPMRQRPRGPKRGKGGRSGRLSLSGLNPYFKVLVAGGFGGDGQNGGQKHSDEHYGSENGKGSGKSKGRGFSLGFNYPPKRRGPTMRNESHRSKGRQVDQGNW
jgi:hypothetical protein